MFTTVENSPTNARLAVPIALFGWYLFAFTSPFSTVGSSLGMALILLATLFVLPSWWQSVRYEPLFWLILVFTLYILIRSLIALQVIPELGESKNPHWTHFLRVSGFISLMMGWWLHRCSAHLILLLLTALAGLLFGAVVYGDWERILAADFSWRSIWGYSPNYLGTMSGIMLLSVFALLLAPQDHRIIRRFWFFALPVVGVLALLLYTSQSRAAWIGTVVGFIVLTTAAMFCYRRNRTRNSIKVITVVAAGLLVALTGVFFSDGGDLLVQRMSREWDTVSLLLAGEWESAASVPGSMGFRLKMWMLGIQAVADKPLFGWGPGTGEFILREHKDLHFGHFHNLYLELLVGFGLVGMVLVSTIAFLFGRAAVRATRRDLWPSALGIGVFAVTVFLAITLLFRIHIGQTEGRAMLNWFISIYALGVFRSSTALKASIGETFFSSICLRPHTQNTGH